MNILEEAIVYATHKHEGVIRKMGNTPYILHPLEVAQIISTMTQDQEVIAAGVLHDIVEDTDGTIETIREKFGERVAALVGSETENKYPDEDKALSWKKRKEESLRDLEQCKDRGTKILWLADKLSNIRSLAGGYSEQGEDVWNNFNQKDPAMHKWYYKSVADLVEYELNRTGAYKEFIKHINFLWPGTFDSDKTRFRKYKEVSIEGCRLIAEGSKGIIYRYDEELIIKVYNENNTYKDVEAEIAKSRKAFIMGLPTAISFGIVAVGNKYGAMFELVDSESITRYIAADTKRVQYYAKLMADTAHLIHNAEADDDSFPEYAEMMHKWVDDGMMKEDEKLGTRINELIDALPKTRNLVHGDFHTGNVLMHDSEPILVDLDRLSTGHPIADISNIYMSYIVMGEFDPKEQRRFMGISKETAALFFDEFVSSYMDSKDEDVIRKIKDKSALICYTRYIRRLRKKKELSDEDISVISELKKRTAELLDRVDTLMI